MQIGLDFYALGNRESLDKLDHFSKSKQTLVRNF